MALFGWFMLCAIALFVSVLAGALTFGSIALQGKVTGDAWVFVAAAVVLWIYTYHKVPFSIVMLG